MLPYGKIPRIISTGTIPLVPVQRGTSVVSPVMPAVAGGSSLSTSFGALRSLGVPPALIAARRFDDLPPAQRPGVLTAAVRGAEALRTVVDRGFADAAAAGQRLGLEVEFHARPTAISPTAPLDRRDTIYEKLSAAARARGHRVELLTTAVNVFRLAADERLYPIIHDVFTVAGRQISTQRFRGHGAVLLTVDPGDGDMTKTRLDGVDDVFAAAPQAYARVRECLGSDVAAAHTTRFMLMTKDLTGDTAKLWVEMQRSAVGDLLAVVTADNGRFYVPDTTHPLGNPDRGGAVETVAVPICTAAELAAQGWAAASVEETFRLAIPVLEQQVRGRILMQKTDRYVGLRVYGWGGDPEAFGDFTIGYEEHPWFELVSPILRPVDFPIVRDIVAALGEQGYVGTTKEHTVGMHMHLDLPTTIGGQMSIAPVLSVARAFLGVQEALYDVIPVEANRHPYIGDMAAELVALLHDPAYGADPADRLTILRVMRDFVTRTDGKYHAINFENHFAALIVRMVHSGLLTVGEELATTVEGESYRFRVALAPITQTPNIYYEERGNALEEAQWKPLARGPLNPDKTTVELRFPDVVHRVLAPGRYAIDADTAIYLLEFGAAFGYEYGTRQPMAAGE